MIVAIYVWLPPESYVVFLTTLVRYYNLFLLWQRIFMPPFEKGGAYCFAHVGRSVCRSVGMSVALNTLCN